MNTYTISPADLTGLASDLKACIRANNAANVDRVGRFILDGQNSLARKRLALIRCVMTEGPLGYPNLGLVKTHGAGCRDIIAQSEWHRKNSALGKKEAA